MKKTVGVVTAILGLTGCSSPIDYVKTKELCESTSRTFPVNQINAYGEGLTDVSGWILSDEVMHSLVVTGKLKFVEQALTSSSHWRERFKENGSDIEGKFTRIELVESDPKSCAESKESYDRYSMYVSGMRPNQCLLVTLHDMPSGKYLLSSEYKKNGKRLVIEYSLSDRLVGRSPLRVVSAWSYWSQAQHPLFNPSPRASCVASPNSVEDVFIAPSNKASNPSTPPVINVDTTDFVGDMGFKPIDIDYKEFYRLEGGYEPRGFVVANQGYRTLLLDDAHFVAHLDFSQAGMGSSWPKVIATDAGALVLDRQRDGLVLSYLDPKKLALRSFRAVVGDSGDPLLGAPGPAGVANAYLRGNRLVVEGRAKGSTGRFFEADLTGLQSMLKN